jgi:tetratricopeptide (TPR) repeat protein
MSDKVKVLFLTADPANMRTRSRIAEEIREITQKIRLSTFRNRLELVSEGAVRVSDLQEALLRHQPNIVHFAGHASQTGGIILEDEAGNGKVINRKAFSEIFRILKDNVQIVVLNAGYAKSQAQALTKTIDFTIGMNAMIEDEAAIIFSAHFYQALAFGRSVKEAFDLAVAQLQLEDVDGAQVPKLLVRKGADALNARIVLPVDTEPIAPGDPNMTISGDQNVTIGGERNVAVVGDGTKAKVNIGDRYITINEGWKRRRVAGKQKEKNSPLDFLPWLFAIIAISLAADVFRRFLGGNGDWLVLVIQPDLIILAITAAVLTTAPLVRSTNPLVEKAASLGIFTGPHKARRRAVVLTGIALVIALRLWMSLPSFAHYYNEKGAGFQHSEQPDLSRALESYQQAVRLNPSFAQGHYNLALVYEDLQDENAMQEYGLAIKYDSHIYPAYNNLARLYLLRGNDNDYEKALTLLNRALELSPQDDDVQYSLYKNLGWAKYKLGNYRGAEWDLNRAILLNKDKAAAHCLLAYVLKAQGKAGVDDECFDCVTLAPGQKDHEAKWVSDANECLMKGESR